MKEHGFWLLCLLINIPQDHFIQAHSIDLHIPLSSSSDLCCDNVSVIYLASNPIFHVLPKHIEVDYLMFVRKCSQVSQTVNFCDIGSSQKLVETPRRFQKAPQGLDQLRRVWRILKESEMFKKTLDAARVFQRSVLKECGTSQSYQDILLVLVLGLGRILESSRCFLRGSWSL